jgi:tRNA modification GTPase
VNADSDTITAQATPTGRGGVCIVRVSGPCAFEFAAAVAGPLPLPRRASLRVLRGAGGESIDRGLVLLFPRPESYTGEDVVEFQLHGSPVLAAMLQHRLVTLGAREADPGEFSRRAFLNGRMDLAQAEAVADLIASASTAAARAAMRSLEGEFSAAVQALAEGLIAARIRVEAGLDFPDEGVDEFSDPELLHQVDALKHALQALYRAAERGRVLHDGLTMVIAGPPNAGKSSLLNRLAGYEAAIVTEQPGTTRDLVREDILVDGMPARAVDTAGLREATDRVELEGIRRARHAMQRADLVLFVTDASTGADASEALATAGLPPELPVLHVQNKIDLSGATPELQSDGKGQYTVKLSALTGAGIELLRSHLKAVAGLEDDTGGTFAARRRHLVALERAGRHIDSAGELIAAGHAVELAAEELRLGQDALGEITGKVSTEDLLGRIFSEFCIGK